MRGRGWGGGGGWGAFLMLRATGLLWQQQTQVHPDLSFDFCWEGLTLAEHERSSSLLSATVTAGVAVAQGALRRPS